jgi:hypothetical protein
MHRCQASATDALHIAFRPQARPAYCPAATCTAMPNLYYECSTCGFSGISFGSSRWPSLSRKKACLKAGTPHVKYHLRD